MNSAVIKKISAVFLCFAMVLLAGCGSSENGSQEPLDEVCLSNTSTLKSDKLTTAERKMLRAVDACMSEAEMDTYEFSSTSAGCTLSFENSTEYELDGYLHCYFITPDNHILARDTEKIDVYSEDKVALPMSFYDSTGSMDTDGIKFCYQVEFFHGESCYRTSVFTREFSSVSAAASFTLSPAQETNIIVGGYSPCSFTLNDFFVQHTNTDSYNLCFSLTKTSGNSDDSTHLMCRVVSDQGVVAYSGEIVILYISTGDTFIAFASYLTIPPGNYTVELTPASD